MGWKTPEARRDWFRRNPDKNREYSKRYREKRQMAGYVRQIDPKDRARWHRRTAYNLQDDAYQKLLELQENRCAICEEEFGDRIPNVDHDHRTNQVRGLVCSRCNTGLAFVENMKFMIAADDYLDNPPFNQVNVSSEPETVGTSY